MAKEISTACRFPSRLFDLLVYAIHGDPESGKKHGSGRLTQPGSAGSDDAIQRGRRQGRCLFDRYRTAADAEGARVKFSGGKPAVIDGPLAETRELIAGFSMIEAKSKEEAIEWVKQWASIDAGGEVELEIRQVYTMEDLTREKANED